MSPLGWDDIWTQDADAKRGLVACFLDETIPLWSFRDNKRLERLLAVYPYEHGPENISKAILQIMENIWPTRSMGMSLETFRAFERFLVASGFRGHFIHQFEVYLVGLNLLMAIWQRTPKEERKGWFGSFHSKLMADGWLLSAMGHDLGYPIESAKKISNGLSSLYDKMGVKEAARDFRLDGDTKYAEREPSLRHVRLDREDGDIVSHFLLLEELVIESVFETLGHTDRGSAQDIVRTSIAENKHGIVSALMLARAILSDLLDATGKKREFDPKAFFGTPDGKLVKKALAAVALHDFQGESHPLSSIAFRDNPLALTLYIADNIQDWERTYIPGDRPWEYRLTKFENKIDAILLQCDLQPSRPVEDVEKAFRDEVRAKSKVQEILRQPTGEGIKVRLTVEFTLQGSDKTKETMEFLF